MDRSHVEQLKMLVSKWRCVYSTEVVHILPLPTQDASCSVNISKATCH